MSGLIYRHAGLRKPLHIMRYLLFFTLILTFTCCGGDENNDNDEDNQDTSASTSDNTPPVVSITSPTDRSGYTSSSTPLTISGIASDSGGVSIVTWSSSTGTNGTCEGTESWEASIDLTSGTNTITVTAEDSAGNTGSDALVVTYTTTATVTLSGTITVPSTNMVDSDVNDENQSYTANDTIDTAQSVSNPVTLGGFVNRPHTGDRDGRSYKDGDIDDYFEVSLTEGDTVSLSISDYNGSSSIDLDLYVYDGNGDVAAYAAGSGGTWSITDFPYTGDYYVNIHAASGASNYVLSIGDQSGSATAGSLSTNRDFVAGQVIVRFKDGSTCMTSQQAMSDHISDLGMKMEAGRPAKEALASMDLSKKESFFKKLGIPDDRAALTAVNTETQEKLNTLLVLKALRRRSDVVSADPNYIIHKLEIPNDTYYSYQWNLPLLNLPDAWDTTIGSDSVIVAVVDTGVLLNHPDLSVKLIEGYDFISERSISNDGDGIDNDPDDPGDEDNSDGSGSFHGTHIAGIIAAETGNHTGIAGVGWSTVIMPIRVLGIGGGTTYDVLQGVRYAAGLDNDSDTYPDTPADIINLSLGGDTYSETEEAVYAEARKAGAIIIAAAGNNADSDDYYPASYEGVVSVSAVDINGDLASYSSYGSNVDVAAPGGDYGDLNGDGYPDYILSACGDDSSGNVIYDYAFMAGTSVAAPHVAGIAALMKAVRPNMTPDEFDQYLTNMDITEDAGDDGRDNKYGYGIIDAYRAVIAALGEIASVLKVSPSSLNLGLSATSAELSVSELGSNTITVTDVSDDADWLTVSEDDVDENGLGAYIVVVDKTGLFDGNYSATITFASDSNTVEVPVKMQVNTSGIVPDAGYHYALLVNPDDLKDIIASDYMEASNGVYEYSFTVSQGAYLIFAGSDRDRDDYIGDAGESFGAYISTDQPAEITADRDISGLDFTTDYLLTMSTASEPAGINSPFLLKLPTKTDKTPKQLFTD